MSNDCRWDPQSDRIRVLVGLLRPSIGSARVFGLDCWRASEKIKADIAVTQATGRANSVRAEAQASADATVLRGNAEATAIKAKADALASNSNLIALTQAERWNGALPTTMVPGSAVPFISVK
jgi:ABC-type Na+ transport system ATPase subunit NatA